MEQMQKKMNSLNEEHKAALEKTAYDVEYRNQEYIEQLKQQLKKEQRQVDFMKKEMSDIRDQLYGKEQALKYKENSHETELR